MLSLHQKQTALFRRAQQRDKVHHAWLLSGPKGIGKTTWAKNRAAELLKALPEYLAYDTHFLKLGSADEPLAIDQLRDAKKFFSYISVENKPKIVLIDNLDAINEKTLNALLKILEEPPQGTLFFLVTHHPHLLLPTLKSRTVFLNFKKLDKDNTAEIVNQQLDKLDHKVFQEACELYQGQPGKIIEYIKHDHHLLSEKFLSFIQGNHQIVFSKGEETKEAFYLLAKLIHKQALLTRERSTFKKMFVNSQNRVVHDTFLYNLDKKTAMIKMLKYL